MTLTEAYSTLGIDPAMATPDQVRAAFRGLILSNHPDTVSGFPEKQKAHDKTIRLIDAYKTLRAAGFPRRVYVKGPAEDPRRTGNSESERDKANGVSWEAQPDKGDAVFDSWVHDFGIGAFYADEMVKNGSPLAITKALVYGLSGTAAGATLLYFGLPSITSASGFLPGEIVACGIGLFLFLGCGAYLVSPINFYVRRKRTAGPQLAGAHISKWPHPERLSDVKRWTLIVPWMLLAIYVGAIAGALIVDLPLDLINGGNTDLGWALGALLGGILMSRWAVWIAPRNKRLVSLSPVALFVLLMATMNGALLGPWDQVGATVVRSAPGLIGIALGAVPAFFPAYGRMGLWKASRHTPVPYGVLLSAGIALALLWNRFK